MNVNLYSNNKGRGLSSLLSDNEDIQHPVLKFKGVEEIDVSKITINPLQPRRDFNQIQLLELADSIRLYGLIQPITIRLKDNQYELIAGERRLRASIIAGKLRVPAFIRDTTDEESAIMALVENVQRENLNAMEVAITFDRILNEYNLTYDELGRKVGKDRSTVNNYLRLLKLPSEIQKLIIIGKISMGHARAIIGLDSIENQKIIIRRILNEQLSVRTVEDLIKTLHKKEIYPPSLPSNQDFQEYINNELFASNQSRLTDIKVKIDKDGEKGALFLSFNNEQDLERIVIHLDKIFQNQEFNH